MPFMLASDWLGHSTYMLTLDANGSWIPKVEQAAANSLSEPTAPAKLAELPNNVVSLFRRQTN
jgi:integrase